MSEEKARWRFGVKRWIVIALIVIGGYAAFGPIGILKPISPVVVLPAEPTGLTIFGFEITNTILATLLTDIVLILMAFAAWRFHKSGKLVPSGFYNAFEAIVQFLWDTVEGATGKWAKRIFPLVATIFLIIFVANMVKLAPGFESIGYLKEAHKDPAYAAVPLFHLGSLTVYTLDKDQPVPVEHGDAHGEDAAHAEDTHGEEASHSAGPPCNACEVVPWLRGSATDLNFTTALAVIAVFMTQVYGVMALGPSYFSKFFQIKELVGGGIFGLINFGVGFLELILEFAKVLSFSFRLFGNIFAGALLLSIVGALVAVAIPPFLYLFEIFFGMIQAYVFYLLATMFISMALVSHHGDDHGEEHH